MKGLYYILLKQDQINDIVGDAIADIESSSCAENDVVNSHWRMKSDDDGLHVEYICLTNCEKEILEQLDFYNLGNIENLNTVDIFTFLKEKNVNFIYYCVGETSVKSYLIEMLSQRKRTSKLEKMPYINVKFNGKLNENLTCLITASKSEIDPVVEQKIFEKIHDFAEDTNHIEIKKYRA
jgi:hypothetical protein